MYCRKCYGKLVPEEDMGRCPNCDYAFDPEDRLSYLKHPFPDSRRIIWHIIATTIVCFIAAFIIANFQLAGASGH